MAHRINERNAGESKLNSSPKKRGSKLTVYEWAIVTQILDRVYECMESDESTGTFTDGGRFMASLSGEQMYDLFEARRKLRDKATNQKTLV